MQRLRLKFSRGEELKFLSHLELMRLWERAIRRAGLPLAYSEGFTPHPQIALAAPLSVGVTSQAELMDVILSRWMPPQSFTAQIEQQLPPGQELQWHHLRDTGARYYDLRALVDGLWLIDCHDSLCVLGMRLRCDEKGAGRPEQVAKALGFSQRPKSIHRTNLILN